MTRRDYLTSLTNEELAEYIDNFSTEFCDGRCTSTFEYGRCYNCILEWLNETIEEGSK